ncbi:MAG: DUF4130 domain-containing protein [Promethearchaeota archaeon]
MRHTDITPELFRQIEEIPKEILENIGNTLAKKAVAMSQKVDSELHSHKAFLRLSVLPHGILYAKSDKMNHHNEEPLVEFFQSRFPTFIVLFESKRGVFSIDQNKRSIKIRRPLETVLQELEKELPVNPLLTDLNEKNYQELWESFAQSQIIQRRGTAKQLVRLSKKWKRTVAEDRTICKQLDDFLSS